MGENVSVPQKSITIRGRDRFDAENKTSLFRRGSNRLLSFGWDIKDVE